MKLVFLSGLALSASLAMHAADPAPGGQTLPITTISTNQIPVVLSNPEGAAALKTDQDMFSYSLGLNLGSNIKRNDVEVNVEAIIRGLKDGISAKTPLMTPQEVQKVQENLRKDMMAKREVKMKGLREKNKVDGEAFLAANAKKEGVKAFDNGLQYKVIKEGAGPKPKPTDRVRVHYRGTLINGTEFDSSSKRGPEPAMFGVSQVIKGWTQALTNMTVGSKWEVFIPSDLAYGEGGSGQFIEPNSALIFEVDLVELVQAEPPAAPITSDIIKVPSKAELDKGAKIEIIKPEDLARITNKSIKLDPPIPK